MSSKYKNELDKITVSDELKSRITAAAESRIAEKSSKPIYSAAFYIRTVAGVAACAAVIFAGVLSYRTFISQNDNPHNSDEPKLVASEGNKTNTEKTDDKEPAPSRDNIIAERQPESVTPEKNITNNIEQKPDAESRQPENDTKVTENNPTSDGSRNDIVPNPDDSLEMSGGVMSPGFDSDSMTVDEICDSLGYRIAVLNYLPDGYEQVSASLMFGSLVQIEYSGNDDTLVYRTEKTNDDVSGDYNEYEYTETHRIQNADVTLKGTGKGFCLAVWNANGSSYSLSSESAIDRDVMIKIIENIK